MPRSPSPFLIKKKNPANSVSQILSEKEKEDNRKTFERKLQRMQHFLLVLGYLSSIFFSKRDFIMFIQLKYQDGWGFSGQFHLILSPSGSNLVYYSVQAQVAGNLSVSPSIVQVCVCVYIYLCVNGWGDICMYVCFHCFVAWILCKLSSKIKSFMGFVESKVECLEDP